MVDVHIFPVLERLVLFEHSAFEKIFTTLNIKVAAPTIYKYVHNFRCCHMFKPYYLNDVAWKKNLEYIKELPAG